jgi:hypothetical protein
MKISEATALIRTPLIEWGKPQSWCDLGSGNGTFTVALAHLLAAGSTIYARRFRPESPRNLLKNDSGYPMQPARTNQRRAKMACNAPIRPLYTFLVTFSESKVSA